MSAHRALTQAVVDALAQAPAIAGGRIYRGRRLQMPAEHASAVYVGLARSSGMQPFAGDASTDWSTVIVIDLCARASAGVDGLTAVDSLLDAVYERLASVAPPQAAQAWLIEPQLEWEIDEAEQTLGAATLVMRASHRTASGSLLPAT